MLGVEGKNSRGGGNLFRAVYWVCREYILKLKNSPWWLLRDILIKYNVSVIITGCFGKISNSVSN
jgi:hypothetical protein